MSYYFTLGEFLEGSGRRHDRTPLTMPVPVHADAQNIQSTIGSAADILVSDKYFNIWDIGAGETAQARLAHFLTATQMYRLSLELLLDKALLAAEDDDTALAAALQEGFKGIGLPQPAMDGAGSDVGELAHPMLEHLSAEDIAGVYIRFCVALKTAEQAVRYQFGNIIALDRGPFYKEFDGYRFRGVNYIRFDKLLEDAHRMVIDGGRFLDDYVASGKQQAESRDLSSAGAYLQAWLQADRAQYLRCADVDVLLSLTKHMPPALKYDIFFIVEQETIKQVYAAKCLEMGGAELIAHTVHIKNAIAHNAAGENSDNVQKLVAETLAPDAAYSGAAQLFVTAAQNRHLEAETVSAHAFPDAAGNAS
tara:strand:+ start:1194 stop:2285 length:1092 start_codon:yes stop_codon:yes gene_type:complete